MSSKLLLLTIAFVMLAEFLIFAPSVGRFRLTYLQEKMSAAHLAALSIEAAPDQMVTAELEEKLLNHVDAYVIDLIHPDHRTYMLNTPMPPTPDESFDLSAPNAIGLIWEAFKVLARPYNRVIQIIGPSPQDPRVTVVVTLDEGPLGDATRDFGGRILILSIVISLITAGLVFLSLIALFVRPMRRMSGAMSRFSANPENAPLVAETGRSDELGVAEQALADMQQAVRTSLRQKTRLAALGGAVSKINHDLRNILSTASLLSERLSMSDDPDVKRITPRLVTALDRAVDLCAGTLTFTKGEKMPLRRGSVDLHAVVDELGADLTEATKPNGNGQHEPLTVDNDVPMGLHVMADADQLRRVLTNLTRNASEAGASTVAVSAGQENGRLMIDIADDGPGLPPRAEENLFQPFAGSAKPGGTGLGLAIAREIMRAHQGDIRLVRSDGQGTVFQLELPTGGMSR